MKSTGITRPIDTLGRVVIPMEIRQAFDIKPKDLLEIYTQGDSIILRKQGTDCIFCGSTSELSEFNGKPICKSCIEKLRSEH